MFQYRQVLVRLRAGDSLRDVARSGLMGRDKPRASSTISSVEPHREVVRRWFEAGVQGRAIHAALKREHAFASSYSAVVRMLHQLRGKQPPDFTVRLSFAPGEASQGPLRGPRPS